MTYEHGCTTTPERDDEGKPVFPCGKKQGRYCPDRKNGGLILLPGAKRGPEKTRTLTIPNLFKPVIIAHREAQKAGTEGVLR
ncbi:hypothetical protein [Oerskovia rustica]|uniref:Uncharacterized protein n=1 Tax=Oerskovia rustica TaxID=2762237 RepID=A0ABR8RTW2_9CELL|nr:hypothetical protein [Oerskovia rustica]MBD7951221.1 hypothetical protein [Oerskovia rustica]